MQKREDALAKQTEPNVAASLGQTPTSGFNIFNSMQNDGGKVHEDIIAQLN